ncbi:hypothetical protein BZA77DRAFT_313023 [Pyronema omphalodes]|nr:hypothetical protein BZA77DRAFT_313023 [Pyronema omphalodes]
MSRRTYASFGSRQNFQASFGLGMDPDSIDEGTTILKAMEKASIVSDDEMPELEDIPEKASIVSDDEMPELEDIPGHTASKRTQAKKRQRQRAKERAAAGEVVGQPEKGKDIQTGTDVDGMSSQQPKNPKTEAKKRARQRKREIAAQGNQEAGQQRPRDNQVPLTMGYMSMRNSTIPSFENLEPPEIEESEWRRKNRERYEANGRSLPKEIVAAGLAEQYGFTPTGDPEMDLIIAMGLAEMSD